MSKHRQDEQEEIEQVQSKSLLGKLPKNSPEKAKISLDPCINAENLERVTGIEPTLFAWEARVLPLNDARRSREAASAYPALPQPMLRGRQQWYINHKALL